MADYDIRLETFTASESEAITGVSQQVQRDWRRRGYLPPIEGKARHNVIALGELIALRALGERGIGPQVAKQSSQFIGLAAAWAALSTPRTVDAGDKVVTQKAAVRIAKTALAHLTNETVPPYFIIWANGRHDWAESLEARFSMMHNANRFLSDMYPSISEELLGAVVIVDAYALGDAIARKAGRPLVICRPKTK